jgi:hypothetical protein
LSNKGTGELKELRPHWNDGILEYWNAGFWENGVMVPFSISYGISETFNYLREDKSCLKKKETP